MHYAEPIAAIWFVIGFFVVLVIPGFSLMFVPPIEFVYKWCTKNKIGSAGVLGLIMAVIFSITGFVWGLGTLGNSSTAERQTGFFSF
ncbi:MAG TPA: hypothetical protein V6C81_09755 [Planktothrix sp.]|jgi:hypothetical protein